MTTVALGEGREAFLGLFSGSVAVTYYHVAAAKKIERRLSVLAECMAAFRGEEILIQGAVRERDVAWVRPPVVASRDELVAEDGDWDLGECQVQGGLVLRMRVDRRLVPRNLSDRVFRQRFVDRLERAKGRALSRTERRELRAEVTHDLLAKALPTLSYVDAFWSAEGSRLLLFSSSQGMRDCFQELFNKTFGQKLDMTLVRILPPFIGLDSPTDFLVGERLSEVFAPLAATTPSEWVATAEPRGAVAP